MKVQYLENNILKDVECDEAKYTQSELRLKKQSKEFLRIPIKDVDKIVGPKRTNCSYCERPEIELAQKHQELLKTYDARMTELHEKYAEISEFHAQNQILKKKVQTYEKWNRIWFWFNMVGIVGICWGILSWLF
jgi:hypothetical protein